MQWILVNFSTRTLSVDPIQIFEVTCFQKPLNPAFPVFNRFVPDIALSQKRRRFWQLQIEQLCQLTE